MPNSTLVLRMKDFFVRQMAYCETVSRDLERLPADHEDETLDRVLARAQEHVTGRMALEREYAELRAEWDAATNLSPADREAVSHAARLASDATRSLAELNEVWRKWADERMTSLTGEISGLQRGRADIGRYNLAPNTGASFIDEKI